MGRDIFRDKRATLSGANFYRLMFIKGNQHHVEVTEKEQEASQSQCLIRVIFIHIFL